MLHCVIGCNSEICFTHQCRGKTRQGASQNSLDEPETRLSRLQIYSDTPVVSHLSTVYCKHCNNQWCTQCLPASQTWSSVHAHPPGAFVHTWLWLAYCERVCGVFNCRPYSLSCLASANLHQTWERSNTPNCQTSKSLSGSLRCLCLTMRCGCPVGL